LKLILASVLQGDLACRERWIGYERCVAGLVEANDTAIWQSEADKDPPVVVRMRKPLGELILGRCFPMGLHDVEPGKVTDDGVVNVAWKEFVQLVMWFVVRQNCQDTLTSYVKVNVQQSFAEVCASWIVQLATIENCSQGGRGYQCSRTTSYRAQLSRCSAVEVCSVFWEW